MSDIYYTDRTRICLHRKCHRARYWGFEYNNLGITRAKRSIHLLAGVHLHAGLAALLQGAQEDEAAEVSVKAYQADAQARQLDIGESENAEEVIKEQSALVEALTRVAALRIVPSILAEYQVLSTEQEIEIVAVSNLVFMSRADAVLRRNESNDLYVLSWKSKGRWGPEIEQRTKEESEHDDQGLSESWSVGEKYGEPVEGVLMAWLIKQERKEYPKGSGQYVTWSPLIRGYRKFNDDGSSEFAWAYTWDDTSEGRERRLGKGWTRFNVWEQPGGVKSWVHALHDGRVQPDAGDCLARQCFMPVPFFRQPHKIESWARQAVEQEISVAMTRDYKDGLDVGCLNEYLDTYFPQTLSACDQMGRCEFHDICHGPSYIADDPVGSGLYVWRQPHHDAETCSITSKIKTGDIA